MTRFNAFAALALLVAGLNIGMTAVFGNNVAADVLSPTVLHVVEVIVGISALVILADRIGWTREI